MNQTNFVQTGGFPLKAERLQELQTAYSIFNALGELAGNKTIITGCTVVGTNVSDGYVFINGELLDFKGGFIGENVIIIEETASKEFENGEVKTVHYTRYATFGTADTSWLWTDFKRVDPITVMMARLDTLEKKSAVFQAGGGMILWNKPANQIPPGWAEVVNWKGRIPVGMDDREGVFGGLINPEFAPLTPDSRPGRIGGSKTKALSVQELAAHDHYMFSNETVSATDVASYFLPNSPNNIVPVQGLVYAGATTASDTSYAFKHSATNPTLTNQPTLGKTSKLGSGAEFSLMNPYRTVLFIEWVDITE